MKKLLLSCLVVLGVGASAQYNYTGDFEEETNVGQYGQFGGGTIEAAAACGGSFGGQTAFSAAVSQSGWMVMLDVVEAELGQTNTGQAATVTLKYKKAANLTGTFYVALMTQDDQTGSWAIDPISATIAMTAPAITTCTTVTGTIPAGAMQPGRVYGIGGWFVRSGSTTGNFYVDDISIVQEAATAVPACTTFTNISNGSVISGGTNALTWSPVAQAVNYKLTVGTTPGGSDVFNGTVAGTSQNVVLSAGTNYYAKVVPSNTLGDATGCSEISFSTNTTVAYCGPLTSTAPTVVAPIKSVNFAGVTKTSDASATTIGPFAAYEDFTSTIFTVPNTTTTLPITVMGITNGNSANSWATTVFIDWNGDGDFEDAGEAYFNTANTMVRVANSTANPVTLVGNITIPSGTAIGQKRMRVKYNFTGASSSPASVHNALSTGCTNMGNGQAEDYTINLIDGLATSDVNKASVSVYPNPFVDVVKISDIKGVKAINIVDASGRTVKTMKPASELNLGQLKAGMYLVNLQYEDGTVKTIKSIKK